MRSLRLPNEDQVLECLFASILAGVIGALMLGLAILGWSLR